MLFLEEVVLPNALDEIEGSLLGRENGGYSVVKVFLRDFVILVRSVDPLIEDVFEIGLEKWLAEVDPVRLAKLIELVEFDKSHSQTVETTLKSVLLPIFERDFEVLFDELEEVEVR